MKNMPTKKIHWYELELITLTDVQKFVSIAEKIDIPLILTDKHEKYKANAKSLLGAMYSCEWSSLYLVSEEDVYIHFKDFIKSSCVRY